MKKCEICNSELRGRQRKFCSRTCKNAFTNYRLQSYEMQQRRGVLRKLKLIELNGMKCNRCGYDANYSALAFHHEDPARKRFALDVRSLSNRKWETIVAEAKTCTLLCANCHAEVHNPGCTLAALTEQVKELPARYSTNVL